MKTKEKMSYAPPQAETVEIKMERCIADSIETTDSMLPPFGNNELFNDLF